MIWKSMIWKSSLKQMMRTPVKTGLFLAVLILASLLVSLGGSLWVESERKLEEFESVFTTIGTVEQKETAMREIKIWDAESKAYDVYRTPGYGSAVPVSVLDFEGADYIQKPEKRVVYGAYMPDYQLLSEDAGYNLQMFVAASPAEDCVPDHAVTMMIEEAYYSNYPYNAPTFYFCDHYNEQPQKLYADKTYFMCVSSAPAHTDQSGLTAEFRPSGSLGSVIYTKDGERRLAREDSLGYEEITDGFYEEGGHFEMWQALMETMERMYYMVPVTATNSTNLRMAFYNGDAFIDEGEDITEEEYENGERVCLVSRKFADRNGLKIGDHISLPLFCADYKNSAGLGAWKTTLSLEGTLLPIFSEHAYKITGIYATVPGSALGTEYQMGDNEIVIPENSIRESDEKNIINYGPMLGSTTSFQIPNGTINDFMKAWNTQGIDELEITFYDKGYSQLKDGLDQMKKMAVMLFGIGLVTALFLLLFFCHLFIRRQSRRMAIERSLGMSRGQCRFSMLSGLMMIVVVGCVTGSFLGMGLVGKMESNGSGNSYDAYYDRTFTSGNIQSAGEVDPEVGAEAEKWGRSVGFFLGCSLVVVAYGMASAEIRERLMEEPLGLLEEK